MIQFLIRNIELKFESFQDNQWTSSLLLFSWYSNIDIERIYFTNKKKLPTPFFLKVGSLAVMSLKVI